MANNKISILQSTKTNLLFLDEGRNAHVYIDEGMAKAEAARLPDVVVTPPRQYNTGGVAAEFFRMGAVCIMVHDKERTYDYPLAKKYVRPGYYNGDLTANILRFKQQPDIRHLEALRECKYLVAGKISHRTAISYAAAHVNKNSAYLCLAFSDLHEYAKWGKDKVEWAPLEVDYRTLLRILNGRGLVINPQGNQLILPSENIPAVREEEK